VRCPDRDMLESFVASSLSARRNGIVRKHLEACARCLDIVDSLRLEAELLQSAFQSKEEDEVLMKRILGRIEEIERGEKREDT
jgi:anti-sigma factor RsiW